MYAMVEEVKPKVYACIHTGGTVRVCVYVCVGKYWAFYCIHTSWMAPYYLCLQPNATDLPIVSSGVSNPT